MTINGDFPIYSPESLKKALPISSKTASFIAESRETVANILSLKDKRLLVLVGPCSVHSIEGVREYAARLSELTKSIKSKIFPVMRVYIEKSRTSLGWTGMVSDPSLDGVFDIARGLRFARTSLVECANLGIPSAVEIVNPLAYRFYDDLVSYFAFGARTVESRAHREIASALSAPAGFKNSTSGNIEAAVNAVISSMHSCGFLTVGEGGMVVSCVSKGNKDSHIILRGGSQGPNFSETHVRYAEKLLNEAKIATGIVVDASHGNSGKDYKKQGDIARELVKMKQNGLQSIAGIMIEGDLEEGEQDAVPGAKMGISVTDPCLGWNDTKNLLEDMYSML